jgi:lipopolysaccharide biosynthesis protein
MRARLVAFYLPQFHPTPENDKWWGKGFTEWSNVVRAKPQFRGHYQPRLPGELGFYDLRVPEVREAQAELARDHGIEGFCYWHYWFKGRRLLERPFNEVLGSGRPDFPFCLAWANHSWNRAWSAAPHSVLIEQQYSAQDDLDHIRWLACAFADRRYIRVNGRPLFLVYSPTDLPEPKRTTEVWRRECVRLGLPEPYLVGLDLYAPTLDMRTLGFDTTEHHEPQLVALPEFEREEWTWRNLARNARLGVISRWKKIYLYSDALEWTATLRPTIPHIPCFCAGWDTTARHGHRAVVLVRNTPEVIGKELDRLVRSVSGISLEDRIVMLNAWNEWGEGMYVEPDARYGRGVLEAIRSVVVEERK